MTINACPRPWLALPALALALVPMLACAHGPSRQKVTETITVAAPAAKVWALIADFCSIERWHPAVIACRGSGGNAPGATRVLTLGAAGGPEVHEELLQYDAEAMRYKYRITEVDLEAIPVTTYSAFLSVADNGDGTAEVQWRGGFYRGYPNNDPPAHLNDEAAVTAITGIYTAGLARIKTLAEQ